ncbi:MAG TPA: HAD-IA family hydrolase [Spirochaetia bacterium]|jgi:phosphoglycolate phosphatase|nr:HAD-IA family hydrolase [Spirochaetia bacterium]
MGFQCFVFDFSGTLADTTPLLIDALNSLSGRYRLRPVAEEERECLRKLNSSAAFKFVGIPRWKLPIIATQVRSILAARMDQVKPVRPELPAVLVELHAAGRRMGIVTSNDADSVERFCEANGLPQFDFIRSSGIFGKARILHQTIHQFDLSPGDVVYIGDETRDIEAAQKAGIVSAAVTWGSTDEEVLERYNPQFLFSSPLQILDLLT